MKDSLHCYEVRPLVLPDDRNIFVVFLVRRIAEIKQEQVVLAKETTVVKYLRPSILNRIFGEAHPSFHEIYGGKDKESNI